MENNQNENVAGSNSCNDTTIINHYETNYYTYYSNINYEDFVINQQQQLYSPKTTTTITKEKGLITRILSAGSRIAGCIGCCITAGSIIIHVLVKENTNISEKITVTVANEEIIFIKDKMARDLEGYCIKDIASENENDGSTEFFEIRKGGWTPLNSFETIAKNNEKYFNILLRNWKVCAGKTKNGNRCKNKRRTKNEFPVWCHHHENQKKEFYEFYESKTMEESNECPWWGEIKREKLKKKDERDIEYCFKDDGSIEIYENQQEKWTPLNISESKTIAEFNQSYFDDLPSKYRCAGKTQKDKRCKNKRHTDNEFPVWCHHHHNAKKDFEQFYESDKKEHNEFPWWNKIKEEKSKREIECCFEEDGSIDFYQNQPEVCTPLKSLEIETMAEKIKDFLNIVPIKYQCAGKTQKDNRCKNKRCTEKEFPVWCHLHKDQKLKFEEFYKSSSSDEKQYELYKWWNEIKIEKLNNEISKIGLA